MMTMLSMLHNLHHLSVGAPLIGRRGIVLSNLTTLLLLLSPSLSGVPSVLPPSYPAPLPGHPVHPAASL